MQPLLHASDKDVVAVKPQSVSVLAPTLNRYSYLVNELEQLVKELKKLKSRVQLPKASKYTKSVWAILRPFYALRQVGVMGYGI